MLLTSTPRVLGVTRLERLEDVADKHARQELFLKHHQIAHDPLDQACDNTPRVHAITRLECLFLKHHQIAHNPLDQACDNIRASTLECLLSASCDTPRVFVVTRLECLR